MKRLLRGERAQGLLARLVAAYMETVIATLRWRAENLEPARAAVAGKSGAVALFWHGRIGVALACRPLLKDRERRAMISLSRDGAFIADAAARLGFPAIRGSTARPDRLLDKGGADALRRSAAFLQSGGIVLVTPDGPRGPARRLGAGSVLLASLGASPVFLVGLAVRPALAPGGWDAARIPLPFSRAAVVIDGPLAAPAAGDAGGPSLEAVRSAWQEGMDRAQARAEALLTDPAGPAFARLAA